MIRFLRYGTDDNEINLCDILNYIYWNPITWSYKINHLKVI